MMQKPCFLRFVAVANCNSHSCIAVRRFCRAIKLRDKIARKNCKCDIYITRYSSTHSAAAIADTVLGQYEHNALIHWPGGLVGPSRILPGRNVAQHRRLSVVFRKLCNSAGHNFL